MPVFKFPAPDGPGQPVHGLRIAVLQGFHATADILQNVALGHGQEVIDGSDVINGLGQDPHLIDPSVSEHLNVLLSDLRPRTCGQNAGGVDDLRAEVGDLGSGVANHLDAVFVVGHGAREIGDFHQLVGVLLEDLGALLHFRLFALLSGRNQHE